MNKNFYVKKLCVQCKNTFTIKYGFDYFLGIALVMSPALLIAMTLYEEDISSLTTQIWLIGYLIILSAGALLLYGHKKRQENCTLCNSEKTLIAIDSPQAIEIIKENNLSVPE